MATGSRPTLGCALLRAGLLSAACLALVPRATATGSADGPTIVPPPVLALHQWTPATANITPVRGVVRWNGNPVSGVRVRVDNYVIPTPTNASGEFTYLVDDTLLQRHPVTIADASNAEVGGAPLTAAQRSALAATSSSITVAYPIGNLRVARNRAGDLVVSGRILDAAGRPPPRVRLATYSLSGTVIDANGKPVVGAQVSTRTIDRDFWTVSTPTDTNGRYHSLFTASDQESDDPVPFTVRIAAGNDVYQFLPSEYVYFRRLESATLNLQLPPSGFAMALPLPKSYPGAIYAGIVVGAADANGTMIRPLESTWTDARGDFSMTLPRSLAGGSVSLWEARLDLFSVRPSVPGGVVDLRDWPSVLAPGAARDLQLVRLS
jgi:hypothetical protein